MTDPKADGYQKISKVPVGDLAHVDLCERFALISTAVREMRDADTHPEGITAKGLYYRAETLRAVARSILLPEAYKSYVTQAAQATLAMLKKDEDLMARLTHWRDLSALDWEFCANKVHTTYTQEFCKASGVLCLPSKIYAVSYSHPSAGQHRGDLLKPENRHMIINSAPQSGNHDSIEALKTIIHEGTHDHGFALALIIHQGGKDFLPDDMKDVAEMYYVLYAENGIIPSTVDFNAYQTLFLEEIARLAENIVGNGIKQNVEYQQTLACCIA